MKLLFVCGANAAGGALNCAPWIKSLAANLSDGYDLTIASTEAEPATPVEVAVGARKVTLRGCSKLIGDENGLAPYDAIVLFGTEKPCTRDFLNVCKKRGILNKTAVFAQGILYPCALHYAEGVPARVINRYTFRDLLRRQNIKKEQKLMFSRAEAEREALALTENFIGRTTMDKAVLRMYNQMRKTPNLRQPILLSAQRLPLPYRSGKPAQKQIPRPKNRRRRLQSHPKAAPAKGA